MSKEEELAQLLRSLNTELIDTLKELLPPTLAHPKNEVKLRISAPKPRKDLKDIKERLAKETEI